MKKQSLHICYLILLTLSLGAQTFEKDMELVYLNFVNVPKIAYQINYTLKASHKTESAVISKSGGKYIKLNNTYLSVYDDKVSLTMPSEIIMIDNQEKRIRVKSVTTKEKTNQPDFITQLKEYNKNVAKVTKLAGINKNTFSYKIELKNTDLFPISSYEITIQQKTNYVEQITMFYKKPLQKNEDYSVNGTEIPRLEIQFYNFNSAKLIASKELEPSYYYSKLNKKLIPSSNFNGYDIKQLY